MKARLLNFLTCPYHPEAVLHLHGFVEVPRPATQWFIRCEVHCGLLDAPAASAAPDDCRRCVGIEVEEGILVCDACRRWFPVTEGIPSVMPDELRGGPGTPDAGFVNRHRIRLDELGLLAPQDRPRAKDESPPQEEIQKKLAEQKARDDQSGMYDQLLSLKTLKIFEAPAYHEALRKTPSGPMLEAGCGTGRLTDVFSSLTTELVCADFSLASLRRNRSRHGDGPIVLHHVQCDLTQLPLREGCVSGIAHAGVYEHIPSKDARLRWLGHAHRVLKPGGKFLISAYRYAGLMRRFPKEGEHAGGIPFLRFTPEEFKDEVGGVFAIDQFTPNLAIYMQMAVCTRR